MTYLLWYLTKTMHLFRCWWLIHSKAVRSISYDSFVLSVMSAGSQLNMSVHWPNYITVHVFMLSFMFVIIWCRFKWKRICAGFLSFGNNALPWEIHVSRREGWNPIKLFNPATLFCLFQARTWISNVLCCALIYVQWVQVRGDRSFCWYYEIVCHNCWNFLIIINTYSAKRDLPWIISISIGLTFWEFAIPNTLTHVSGLSVSDNRYILLE